MVKKIIILDVSVTKVYIFPFDTAMYDEEYITDFFDDINDHYDLGLKESQCSWMMSEGEELEIKMF